MTLDTLRNTLIHEMSDLLSAETQFAKALTQVAKAADGDTVRQLAEEHLQQTQQQAENLKEAFSKLGEKPEKGVVCKGAQGIVTENNETIKEEKPKGQLKDLALMGGCLRVEHYEIAAYTAAIGVAKALGEKEVSQILDGNLKQEKETAKKLQDGANALLAEMKSNGAANAAPAQAAAPKAKAAKK